MPKRAGLTQREELPLSIAESDGDCFVHDKFAGIGSAKKKKNGKRDKATERLDALFGPLQYGRSGWQKVWRNLESQRQTFQPRLVPPGPQLCAARVFHRMIQMMMTRMRILKRGLLTVTYQDQHLSRALRFCRNGEQRPSTSQATQPPSSQTPRLTTRTPTTRSLHASPGQSVRAQSGRPARKRKPSLSSSTALRMQGSTDELVALNKDKEAREAKQFDVSLRYQEQKTLPSG